MRQKNELRPYQERIATHLYEHNEAICIGRMGSGKTAATLTAISELLRDGVIRHALIVAPKRVARMVWPDEIGAWSHIAKLRYQVLTGTPKQRLGQLCCSDEYHLTIVGIDILPWLLTVLENVWPQLDHPLYDLLVIDEISKLRSPTGVRSKALAKAANRWRMIWGMSGTLRPNSALDLFMPARIVTRGELWGKSYYQWRQTRFYPKDFHGYEWAPLPGAEDKLNAELAPYVVTLNEDEYPQMPELSVIYDRVELPPAARREYDSMQRHLFAKEGDILAGSAAIATGKLAQMANGFAYDPSGKGLKIHDAKREWLEDVVEQATGPMLLVYEFLEDLEMMREVVGDDLPYLGAGVSDKDADLAVQIWNNGDLPFMALHPAAGGHGLNLQHGGSDMAWIAPTWSPEMWEQTVARIHRPGQTKPVMVRVCVAANTVDEMKLNRVQFKMTAQQAFETYLRAFHVKPK